jgi:hypothetical protein
MCALCGGIEQARHWTDPLDGTGSAADEPAGWRRSRHRQVAFANRILSAYGLEARDWDAHAFVLSNRTGHSELVLRLAAVWAAAERLGRCRCDPLDPALLARLEREGGTDEGVT